MPAAKFNKTVNFSGRASYKYADLSSVIEAIRKPLSDNNLALTQATEIRDGGFVLVTTLRHGSGQWIASEYPLPLAAKPQDLGSAMTYAKRYSITSLICIAADEDDDAAAAQQNEQAASTPKPAAKPAPAKPAPVAPPVNPMTGEVSPHLIVEANDMRWGAMFVAAIKAAKSNAEIKAWADACDERLKIIAQNEPKIYDRLVTNIETASAALKEAAA
jgi:hypothetical protein